MESEVLVELDHQDLMEIVCGMVLVHVAEMEDRVEMAMAMEMEEVMVVVLEMVVVQEMVGVEGMEELGE